MSLPCLSIGGLCCFVLLQLQLAPSHSLNRARLRLSVCQVFALLWYSLLTVCAFYLFFSIFHLPKQTRLLLYLFHICISVHRFFPLLLSFSSCILSSPLLSSPFPVAFAVLGGPTEAIRTDGCRGFPGSAHFYRIQPGTAADDVLTGCLQVTEFDKNYSWNA